MSLNVDYTTLYNKLSTYALTSALCSYLTTASAASTYLSQTNAASTYLTQTNAAANYHAIPRIQAYCSSSGSISNTIGTTTISGKSTGTYPLSFSGGTSGFPFVQCLTASASVSYNANVTSWAGSSCTVVVKDSSNTLVDANFWFIIFLA